MACLIDGVREGKDSALQHVPAQWGLPSALLLPLSAFTSCAELTSFLETHVKGPVARSVCSLSSQAFEGPGEGPICRAGACFSHVSGVRLQR